MSTKRYYFSIGDGLAELREKVGLPPVDKYAGETSCLKCLKKFESDDKRSIRICPECRDTPAFREAGEMDARFPPSIMVGRASKKKPQADE